MMETSDTESNPTPSTHVQVAAAQARVAIDQILECETPASIAQLASSTHELNPTKYSRREQIIAAQTRIALEAVVGQPTPDWVRELASQPLTDDEP
ncbi:hypothetical protein [Cryobacterium sp. BB307]|uniref:hypothetical protein n=1 Tax=Cryobacterium sp. BB307 TaxID=2716317 RepID=UPI0014467E84|nr:hypothetical protein [Cryobacterium sp. BB307]